MATHSENSSWSHMFNWAFSGVDHSLPGNGGPECANFLCLKQRFVESIFFSFVALFVMWLAYPKLTLPAEEPRVMNEKETSGKRILLMLMCLTWGCELGFKFATRQMIWIFNPCHIATAIQIYLLAASPSKCVTAVFRLHMHMLTGAPIALLFPVINTRLLTFEIEVYYIQHVLLLIIPFYLMHLGDPYIPERPGDFSWAAMTGGLLFIYHFIPLQVLALATQVNLNNMLCPAVSDPFHGPYYRLCAAVHQMILIPSLGKIYASLAQQIGWCPNEVESVVSLHSRENTSNSSDRVGVTAIETTKAVLQRNNFTSGPSDERKTCVYHDEDKTYLYHDGEGCGKGLREEAARHIVRREREYNREVNGIRGCEDPLERTECCSEIPRNGHLKDH